MCLVSIDLFGASSVMGRRLDGPVNRVPQPRDRGKRPWHPRCQDPENSERPHIFNEGNRQRKYGAPFERRQAILDPITRPVKTGSFEKMPAKKGWMGITSHRAGARSTNEKRLENRAKSPVHVSVSMRGSRCVPGTDEDPPRRMSKGTLKREGQHAQCQPDTLNRPLHSAGGGSLARFV